MRLLWLVLLLLTACSTASNSAVGGAELPAVDGDDIRVMLAELDRPAVVNVWASWCLPCRSEAPLLAAAHAQLGEEVRFIGIDVEDDMASALQFIEEFGLDFEHYFDPDRQVPARLGGVGVPITYFVEPGGHIVEIHSGILDEPTLALMIDELRS